MGLFSQLLEEFGKQWVWKEWEHKGISWAYTEDMMVLFHGGILMVNCHRI